MQLWNTQKILASRNLGPLRPWLNTQSLKSFTLEPRHLVNLTLGCGSCLVCISWSSSIVLPWPGSFRSPWTKREPLQVSNLVAWNLDSWYLKSWNLASLQPTLDPWKVLYLRTTSATQTDCRGSATALLAWPPSSAKGWCRQPSGVLAASQNRLVKDQTCRSSAAPCVAEIFKQPST